MLVTALLAFLTVVALPSLHLSSTSATRLSAIVIGSTAALSCHVSTALALGSGVSLFGGLMHATPTSYTVDALLGLIGALALTPWASFTLFQGSPLGQLRTIFSLLPTNLYWPLLVLFSVTGSSFLASSTSMLTLYLSLELQSFGVYVLAALYRDSETATDAGLTYFLLGGLSSCFILLGSGQLYAALGVTSLEHVYALLTPGASSLSTVVGFSLTVLGCGLSFKIAAAPFHQWAPDVYDRVPTIVTTWLQTMPKLAVLGIMLELTRGLNLSSLVFSDRGGWTATLMLVALLSLIFGSVVGLAQVRVKRLLTYSTISHVGFMLLTLTAFSTDAVGAFLFYLVQYSVTSLASLSLLLAFGYVLRGRANDRLPNRNHATDLELLSELTGRVASEPMLSLGFAALLFSMAGVPPFIGFFAKLGVLEASLSANYGGLAVLAVLVSVISASYYLKVVRLMFFSNPSQPTVPALSAVPLSGIHTFFLSTIILSLSLYMLLPSAFLDSTRALAVTLTLT